MIAIQNETLIPFADLPSWCQQHLGRRISPSTLHRWRLRGCRGIKLETLLIGGTRTTSAEALQRFFFASTAAQDGQPATESRSSLTTKVSGGNADAQGHDDAVAFLKAEGI